MNAVKENVFSSEAKEGERMSEVLLIIAALFLMITVAIWREARDYNHGFCKKCGSKLQFMDEDSQGGRGYICRKCGYVTWCSYSVDKEG